MSDKPQKKRREEGIVREREGEGGMEERKRRGGEKKQHPVS